MVIFHIKYLKIVLESHVVVCTMGTIELRDEPKADIKGKHNGHFYRHHVQRLDKQGNMVI